MTNLINDFINLKLIEGNYYFVINPDENNLKKCMKFRIENRNCDTVFGVLEDIDTIYNSIHHRNLIIQEIPQLYSDTHDTNKKIVIEISKVVEKHPDWRFQQILWNMGIIYYKDYDGEVADSFYEKSKDTLKHIEENKDNY